MTPSTPSISADSDVPGRLRPVRHLVLLLFVLAAGGACTDSVPDDFESLADAHQATIEGTIRIAGLEAPVEVIRDRWGVPHIYAESEEDLFLAQGFVHAQDRLWQMDLYRRAGEGRLAEILGEEAVRHDRLARLVRYRGPWTDEEFSSYHPRGRQILESFASGVNAYIEWATEQGELPVEYAITGLEPEAWTVQASLLRMQTAMPLGDARAELRLAQQVAEFGAEEANRRANPTPYRDLVVPEGVDLSIIADDVVDGLSGFRGSMASPELEEPYREWLDSYASAHGGARETSPGSNNWVLAPERTATGAVFMANDPHRAVTNPSLRYVVHLEAPGWSVTGSTEPVLPGIAIGHNGRVAWGLTIVGTDQSDVYVETINPENPRQVRWQDGWEDLEVVTDTIRVKDGEPVVTEFEFSRHGPIFHRDDENGVAYALRSTMHEPGTTGYLAALRLNVVDDCAAFLEELSYYYAPTENMMCGDVDGNIAWQASALSPLRSGWHGRLPVPGDGRYEWEGFRDDLPEEYNPERGWIATANHDIHPEGYDPPLYFKRDVTYARSERLFDVLAQLENATMEDMKALQLDAWIAQAEADVALFRGWTSDDADLEELRAELAEWDGVMDRDSRSAVVWSELRGDLSDEVRALEAESRQGALEEALSDARAELTEELGPDASEWRWGRIQRSEFPHSLVAAWDLPDAERSGGAGSVAATGATYRQIVDFSDPDASIFTNAPGQSARPGSPYYGNLLEDWAAGEYFPVLFTREAVEAGSEHRLVLDPQE